MVDDFQIFVGLIGFRFQQTGAELCPFPLSTPRLATQRLVGAVFPLIVRSKEPAVSRGFKASTTNPETVRRYWRVPDRNIGIATGAISGVWVLDVDGDGGAASLAALEAEHGKLPDTWVSSTGRGWHVWLRYTTQIPSSTGRVGLGLYQQLPADRDQPCCSTSGGSPAASAIRFAACAISSRRV